MSANLSEKKEFKFLDYLDDVCLSSIGMLFLLKKIYEKIKNKISNKNKNKNESNDEKDGSVLDTQI